MAAFSATLRMEPVQTLNRADWKAMLASELTGLAIGVVTLVWILSSLTAL